MSLDSLVPYGTIHGYGTVTCDVTTKLAAAKGCRCRITILNGDEMET
jgi:hypothetical protein